MKADVKAQRPAMNASGHVVADRLVGSIFHCLSVARKRNGKGLGSLPLHVENTELPEFWGHFVGGTGLW